MAPGEMFLGLVFVTLLNFSASQVFFISPSEPIAYKTVSDCVQIENTRQYYDVSKLTCLPCSQNSTFQKQTADGEFRLVLKNRK